MTSRSSTNGVAWRPTPPPLLIYRRGYSYSYIRSELGEMHFHSFHNTSLLELSSFSAFSCTHGVLEPQRHPCHVASSTTAPRCSLLPTKRKEILLIRDEYRPTWWPTAKHSGQPPAAAYWMTRACPLVHLRTLQRHERTLECQWYKRVEPCETQPDPDMPLGRNSRQP